MDQHAGGSRAEQRAELEHRGVEADGVADVGLPDQLGDEDLTGGVVDHGDEAENRREDVDVPGLDRTGQGEQCPG